MPVNNGAAPKSTSRSMEFIPGRGLCPSDAVMQVGGPTNQQFVESAYVKAVNSNKVDASLEQHACSVWLSGSQTIATATWTIIPFDRTDYDLKGIFESVASRFRIKEPGRYLITSTAQFVTTTTWRLAIYVNAVSKRVLQENLTVGAPRTITDIRDLKKGDMVDIEVYQASGVGATLGGGSDSTWCSISRLL